MLLVKILVMNKTEDATDVMLELTTERESGH